MNCNSCGNPVQPQWKVCPFCSQPLPIKPVQTNPVSFSPSFSNLNIQDSIYINKSTQEVNSSISTCKPVTPNNGFNLSTSATDSVIIDKRTINIKQEIKIPGKYSLNLFPDSIPPFVAYRATDINCQRIFVAKNIGSKMPVDELNKCIRQLGLSHLPPNVASYLPAEELQGDVFLMREYCQGSSCTEYFKRNGILRDVEILGILYRVCESLCLNNKAHGSLRPQNIFLEFTEPNKKIKAARLSDFGISDVKEYIGRWDESMCPILNECKNNDPYNSVRGKPLEPAERDCYALGFMAFEWLGINLKETQNISDSRTYFNKYGKMPNPELIELLHKMVIERKVKSINAMQTGIYEIIDGIC